MRKSLLFIFQWTAVSCVLAIPILAQTIDSLDRPALAALGPEHSVLLDAVKTGGRIIAVGERGVIVLSDDDGHTWRQANVPTSVTLTRVKFATPKAGWVVGHSGVALHTEDGGESWTRQLDGRTAARLALETAQADMDRAGANNAAAQRALANAQLLVSDGPDKPFLDLYFENQKTGHLAGASTL